MDLTYNPRSSGCPAPPILLAWQSGKPDTHAFSKVTEHVLGCPACQSYLTDYATATLETHREDQRGPLEPSTTTRTADTPQTSEETQTADATQSSDAKHDSDSSAPASTGSAAPVEPAAGTGSAQGSADTHGGETATATPPTRPELKLVWSRGGRGRPSPQAESWPGSARERRDSEVIGDASRSWMARAGMRTDGLRSRVSAPTEPGYSTGMASWLAPATGVRANTTTGGSPGAGGYRERPPGSSTGTISATAVRWLKWTFGAAILVVLLFPFGAALTRGATLEKTVAALRVPRVLDREAGLEVHPTPVAAASAARAVMSAGSKPSSPARVPDAIYNAALPFAVLNVDLPDVNPTDQQKLLLRDAQGHVLWHELVLTREEGRVPVLISPRALGQGDYTLELAVTGSDHAPRLYQVLVRIQQTRPGG